MSCTYGHDLKAGLDPSLLVCTRRNCGHSTRTAEYLKAQGQARAEAASSEWSAKARKWLADRPQGSRFTSEDLTEAVGQPPSSGAVGAAMTGGGASGIMRKVDRAKAKRLNQHSAEIAVWERI